MENDMKAWLISFMRFDCYMSLEADQVGGKKKRENIFVSSREFSPLKKS